MTPTRLKTSIAITNRAIHVIVHRVLNTSWKAKSLDSLKSPKIHRRTLALIYRMYFPGVLSLSQLELIRDCSALTSQSHPLLILPVPTALDSKLKVLSVSDDARYFARCLDKSTYHISYREWVSPRP